MPFLLHTLPAHHARHLPFRATIALASFVLATATADTAVFAATASSSAGTAPTGTGSVAGDTVGNTAASAGPAASTATASTPFAATFDPRSANALRDSFLAAPGAPSPSPELLAARTALLRQADALLPARPLSVMDKTGCGASGDKHDFFAIGKFAFPNPASPDGKPWFRKDGKHNPAAAGPDYDKARYNLTLSRVQTLCLAWHHSGDERYAAKAAELLRAWFLDPATRMYPNFKYASALPGVHDGMPIGIIEGVALIGLADHVGLLASSRSWTPADAAGLRRWFADYVDWLLTSDFGKSESRMKNNHGVWYAAQIAALSLHIGDASRVRAMVESARAKMAAEQTPEGGFASELARKQSLHYSVYVLQSYVTLARCGERTGDDLWRHRTPNGRSLERAVAFLAPYLAGDTPWAWPDIDADKPPTLHAATVFRLASSRYPDLAPLLHRATDRVLAANRKSGSLPGVRLLLGDAPAPARTLVNPIAPIGNDPWVIHRDGAYHYCYSWAGGLWVHRDTRLDRALQFPGKKVWTPPSSGPTSRNLWAPELHFLAGKWYLYFAADDGANENHRMYVLEADTDDPTGSYTLRGKLAVEPDRWAIDGTVLEHRGALYFIWSGWEGKRNVRQDLYIARMASPTALTGPRARISTPEHDWEKQGRPLINEGPTALVRAGRTFIVYSASGSWGDHYCLGLLELVGDDPLQATAWRKHPAPVFTGTPATISPGHASFTRSPDGREDWIVYHAAHHAGAGWKRNTRIQPFTWHPDGTPNFGRPVDPGIPLSVPSGSD